MAGVSLATGPAVVREWQADDVAELAKQANDRRVWLGLRDAFPHPYGVEDARRFIATAVAKSPPTFFAITVAGAVAGGVG